MIGIFLGRVEMRETHAGVLKADSGSSSAAAATARKSSGKPQGKQQRVGGWATAIVDHDPRSMVEKRKHCISETTNQAIWRISCVCIYIYVYYIHYIVIHICIVNHQNWEYDPEIIGVACCSAQSRDLLHSAVNRVYWRCFHVKTPGGHMIDWSPWGSFFNLFRGSIKLKTLMDFELSRLSTQKTINFGKHKQKFLEFSTWPVLFLLETYQFPNFPTPNLPQLTDKWAVS